MLSISTVILKKFFFFSYVVSFDFPRNIEDYVHRIGRTGRAGYVVFSVACIGTATLRLFG